MKPLLNASFQMVAPAGQVCPVCGGVGEWYGERDGCTLRECIGGAITHAPVLLSWQWDSSEAYEKQYTTPGRYHVEMQRAALRATPLERDVEHLTAGLCRVNLLKQFLPNGGVLLDIGAGAGAFVAIASACGYTAMGLEPSELYSMAKDLGRKVEEGGWNDATGLHDAVFLHDVLEHVTQPYLCLYHLSKRLATGGLLVVEMPEWDTDETRSKQADYRHIKPLEHPVLYSEGAARFLFAAVGLRVESVFRPLRGRIGKIAFYLSKVEDVPGAST